MKNESVKNLPEKSENVLEEKRKMFKQKMCMKNTEMFTIIATHFVREQLIIKLTENENPEIRVPNLFQKTKD